MNINEKIEIYNKAVRIWEADDLSDDEKYDLIFSDEISRNFNFDWYDPDTSYEEDVNAYMWALEEHINKLKRINKYL